jgi:hypothetical protein
VSRELSQAASDAAAAAVHGISDEAPDVRLMVVLLFTTGPGGPTDIDCGIATVVCDGGGPPEPDMVSTALQFAAHVVLHATARKRRVIDPKATS